MISALCYSFICKRAKKQCIFVSLQEKLEAIKRSDKGKRIKKLACKYGVHEVSVGEKFYSVSPQIKDYSHTKLQKI